MEETVGLWSHLSFICCVQSTFYILISNERLHFKCIYSLIPVFHIGIFYIHFHVYIKYPLKNTDGIGRGLVKPLLPNNQGNGTQRDKEIAWISQTVSGRLSQKSGRQVLVFDHKVQVLASHLISYISLGNFIFLGLGFPISKVEAKIYCPGWL